MRSPAPRLLIAAVSLVSLLSLGSAGAQEARELRPPEPFQDFAAPPSAPIQFLLSERGHDLLRRSGNPQAARIRRALGIKSGSTAGLQSSLTEATPLAVTASANCGTSGTKFNREGTADAMPQNEESLDFLQNRGGAGIDLVVLGANDYRGFANVLGGSSTGYYVQRTNADCNPEAEGGLPGITNPLNTTVTLLGNGDPVVAADAGRDAFFMADLRFDDTATAVGVFRTTAANLLSATTCPTGTHTGTQAAACWPKHTLLSTKSGPMTKFFVDKPHLAVDERASGTGAGRVYVTGTLFDITANTSRIWLVGCSNDLASCSAPLFVSGSDTGTQMSHVAVRPDGGITISYINFPPTGMSIVIRYAHCTTATPPAAPTCAAPTTVFNETNPVGGFLGTSDFRIMTYPKHAHRVDSNGTETYMVWERCKGAPIAGATCPDSDVVLSASTNNGGTWSAPVVLDTALGSQFFPWIAVDKSLGTMNIVYFSATESWRHRYKVMLVQVPPGGATPDAPSAPLAVTAGTNEPDGDPFVGGMFIGDYIGVAARGSSVSGQSVVYVGYTWNSRNGTYGGFSNPQQDDRISRLTY
jgi:hypothetical protein